jgi:pimeloyl-ACP methyl ester carboxylesterase
VGTGLAGYIPLLRPFLATCSHRPIFFVEAPYVAMRFWENIPTPFETAELIHAMLQQHAFEKAAFVGHSFGSISVAWVCKVFLFEQ